MSSIRYGNDTVPVVVAQTGANVVCVNSQGMSVSLTDVKITENELNRFCNEEIDFGAVSAQSSIISTGVDGSIGAISMPATMGAFSQIGSVINITRTSGGVTESHELTLKEAYVDAVYEPAINEQLYSKEAVATISLRIILYEDFVLGEATHTEVEFTIVGRTIVSHDSSDIVVGDGQFAFTYCAESADEGCSIVFTPPVGDADEARRRAGIHISNFVKLKKGDQFTFTDEEPAKWTSVYGTGGLWDGTESTPMYLIVKEIPNYVKSEYVADSDTGSLNNILTDSIDLSEAISEECYICILAIGNNLESFEHLTYSIESGAEPTHTYPASVSAIGELTQEDIERWGYAAHVYQITGTSQNYGSGTASVTLKDNGMGFGEKSTSSTISILIPNMSVGYEDGLYFDFERFEEEFIINNLEFSKEIIIDPQQNYKIKRDGEDVFTVNKIQVSGKVTANGVLAELAVMVRFDDNSRYITFTPTIQGE